MKIKDLVPFAREQKEEMLRRRDDPFYALQTRMNRLFDDFLGDFGRFPLITPWEGVPGSALSPRIDVSEDAAEVTVTAELPGIEEKDLELLLADDLLTIKGEKKMESERRDKEFYRSERVYGSFCRTIPLPAAVEREKTEAVFKDGVLKVRLPKTAEAQKAATKIEVKKG